MSLSTDRLYALNPGREDVKERLSEFKEQEVSFEKQVAAFETLVEAQAVGVPKFLAHTVTAIDATQSAFEALMALYPPMLEEVGPRRAERLNSASKFSE